MRNPMAKTGAILNFPSFFSHPMEIKQLNIVFHYISFDDW